MNRDNPRSACSSVACRGALYWVGLACAIVIAGYSASARLATLAVWKVEPHRYFVAGQPVMATQDAYYNLRFAQMYLTGDYHAEAVDPLRHYQRLQYPLGTSEYWRGDAALDWYPQRIPRRLPLVSWVLAQAAPLAGGVDWAGLYVPPLLAGLFVLPLFIYAWRIGQPAAGLLAGLVGSFSAVYYSRTLPGWADTDCLNLFFPWVASLVILCIEPRHSRRVLWTYAAVLGVVLFGFYRWYDKPALSLLYWGALSLHLLLQRRTWRDIAAATFICVLCSHPIQALHCLENFSGILARYLADANPSDGISSASAWFPNVMQTVAEYHAQGTLETLGRVLSSPILVLVGTGAFLVHAIRAWRRCVPLLPLIVIAAFTFVSGPRFGMYLAPLAGFGLGLITSALIRRLMVNLPEKVATRATWLSYGLVLFIWAIAVRPLTAHGTFGRALAVPADIRHGLQEAAALMPAGARVWTWWDYGFALVHLAGFSVYHDGASQYTPQTNLIAHSLAGHDQQALANTMAFVDAQGNRGIEKVARQVGNRAELITTLAQSKAASEDAQFLLFTRNMLDAMSALRYAAGLEIRDASGAPLYFEPIDCQGMQDNRLDCGPVTIALDSGTFSDGRVVRKLVFVDQGRVVKELDYPHQADSVLQIVLDPNRRIEVFRVPYPVFESNLNQLFLLGRFDSARFEEVYNRAPWLRVYRKKS